MEIQNPINCENGAGASYVSDYKMEIDVTPNTANPIWAELREGITNFDHSTNDVLDQPSYMSGGGWGSTEVTGGQYIVSISGDRVVGDVAQDFVFSRAFQFGCQRKTNFRVVDPEGNSVESVVTIANIKLPGGGGASKAAFSFEIHYNGEPVFKAVTPGP